MAKGPHPARAAMLARIRDNIQQHGFHHYLILGGLAPRFAYTIGLRESLGAELVLAGAISFGHKADIGRIFHGLRDQLAGATPSRRWRATYVVDGLGTFTLRAAHSSWTRKLLLGATDYYQVADVAAYQVVPDDEHYTIDVPDMTRERSADAAPVWQWLDEPCPYPISAKSEAITDLAALRGARITEACRWEADYWELFAGAGPDVVKEDTRLVPLACLLAADPSLAAVLELEVGAGLWRDDEEGAWVPWESEA